MKTVIHFLLVVFYILLSLFSFLWFMYHGSGHKIPIETDRSFIFSILINILIIIILKIILKRISRKEKE